MPAAKFVLRAGAKPVAVEAAPERLVNDDGIELLGFANLRAVRKYVEALERKNPTKPVTIKSAEIRTTFPGTVALSIHVGGDDFFRSATKTALVFAAGRGLITDDELSAGWRYVNGGAREEADLTVGVTNAHAPWRDGGLGHVPHRVAVAIHDGRFRADIRYFGDLAVAVEFRVPDRSIEWSGTHGIDPLTGTTAFGFPEPLGGVPDQSDPAIDEHFRSASALVAALGERVMHRTFASRLASDAVKDAFRDLPEGAPISEGLLTKLARASPNATSTIRIGSIRRARRPTCLTN